MQPSLKKNIILSACAFVTIVGSIIIQRFYFNYAYVADKSSKVLLSEYLLSTYDGVHNEKLYLAVLGSIFDVSNGARHYAKGSSYNYFIGKDGTRALVTGNFKDESVDKDHVLDLKCDDIFAILQWRKTFREKYTYVGLLQGRYYESDGTETEYMKKLKIKIRQCKKEKEKIKQQEQLYPPCNIAWSEGDGTRVWCTESSGGVVRNWIGVPRQMYVPGSSKPTCVCVREDTAALKQYDGCPETATECYVNVD